MLIVLIVEDNADRISFFQELYKFHTVVLVKDSKQAISALQTQEFDLIHLDYDLDDETSIDVARFIAENSLRSKIIIHSENPEGVNSLKELLPESFSIPFTILNSKNSLSNQLKSLLYNQGIDSIDRILKLLQEHSNK